MVALLRPLNLFSKNIGEGGGGYKKRDEIAATNDVSFKYIFIFIYSSSGKRLQYGAISEYIITITLPTNA